MGGIPLENAKKAIIMVHGRGGTAEDILMLGGALNTEDMAVLAPQATENSWYPYSFLSPLSRNQPSLDSALQTIDEVVAETLKAGIEHSQLYFAGFSQGACLVLEYAARNAKKYGGIVAFTGGLIGDTLAVENYHGVFQGTKVFLSGGTADAHVPVSRIKETVEVLERKGAVVHQSIYADKPHGIWPVEIKTANEFIF